MYLTPLLFSLSLCRGCDEGWQRRECLSALIVAGLTSAATFHVLFGEKVKYRNTGIVIFLIVKSGVCAFPDFVLLFRRKTPCSL